MYTFQPLTEEEISSYSLMEEGIYDFEVSKSIKKVSKSNNPMAELTLKVWDKEGKSHLIYDYLIFSKVPLNIKKVKHFCDTTGLFDNYKRGECPEELSTLSGKVHIGIQEEQQKPSGGFYPKKNVVIDYIKAEKGSIAVGSTFKDYDVPF